MIMTDANLKIYTIGHSNRSWEDFLALLKANGIERLADVRSFPGSRYNPQFNAAAMDKALAAEGIEYLPFKGLGGRRKPDPDSTSNMAWQHPAFRAYADYMQTEPFEESLEALIRLASEKPTAVMCSEAVPWRCHRSLLADALLARDVEVADIISPASVRPHQMTGWARVEGTRITYPLPLDVL